MRLFDSKWQNSSVHQLFLLTFLQPRTLEDYPDIPSLLPYATWEEALEEDPLRATDRFQALGVVVHSSLSKHLDYKFTKEELQQMLRQRNLPTSGNKVNLIASLIREDKQGMQAEVSNLMLLECSKRGRQIAKEYWENPQVTIDDKRVSTDTLREAVKWILIAAVGGVIGNRADDAFVAFFNYAIEQQQTIPTVTPHPTETPQPDETPQSEIPTFGPLANEKPRVISDAMCELSGTVLDASSNESIASALINFKRTRSFFHPNTSAWTLTNHEGRYRLIVMIHDTDSYLFEVSAIGYTPFSLNLTGMECFRTRNMNVEMRKLI